METNDRQTRRFALGLLSVSRNALHSVERLDLLRGVERHAAGDWGDVCEADREENELSLQEGFRLISVYHDRHGVKFWVITEADRSATTVLLPEDY